jgi:uncharacterized protein (DUF885 family)
MKKVLYLGLLFIVYAGCKTKKEEKPEPPSLAPFLQEYYDSSMKLFPLTATYNGDKRYNDLLPITFTDRYGDTLRRFYQQYSEALKKFDRNQLSAQDRISYDLVNTELEMGLMGLKNRVNDLTVANHNYIPFNQFYGLPNSLAQMASGEGIQPFNSVQDYDSWLKRARRFSSWTDSAIAYFRRGVDSGIALPKPLVRKMIPQLRAMVSSKYTSHLFYSPIKKMPDSFPDTDKTRLSGAYINLIKYHIVPSYKKLADFLRNEYLKSSHDKPGVDDYPHGSRYYTFLAMHYTTTNKSPMQIRYVGLMEVKRIREEMEKVKNSVGFKGDLKSFFKYLRTDRKFMPYKTPEEVLQAFRNIQKTIEPNLDKYFKRRPKTKFEIRRTESFREHTASAEYLPGLPDGSRPGIFYIPIPDATKFNITSGMESLFLHEAIPGHHFQGSLQMENDSLPEFRKYIWITAYGEGYALYCESLGKQLGLYTDPYQYMGALGDEMHRALRLVVDVSLHYGKMTREEAIQYLLDNEAIPEQMAIAEVERYMAIPGQALAYKTGSMKIMELRAKYEKALGDKFNIAEFHDELLKDGCLPLNVLERKLDEWVDRVRQATQKKG